MRPIFLFFALAAGLAAQQPDIRNARLETRTVRGGLDATFHSIAGAAAGPAWIGYSVPAVHQRDSDSRCLCFLESEGSYHSGASRQVNLEGPADIAILFRVEKGQTGKIRFFDEPCQLDAGELPFYWIQAVNPAESVHLLASFVRETGHLRDSAIAAIAMHRDPEADRMLESLLRPDQPEELRKKTVFWLGSARGRRGYEILDGLMRHDPSPEVRAQAVFALSISREPEALNDMIRAARDDQSPHVRGQALFWLAQKAQKKIAVETLENAVENDPDTEVKKKAVFAFSQMPAAQGTPILIRIAQTNRNREVRKQAMFWLGQSKDPRALRFFEQVLEK